MNFHQGWIRISSQGSETLPECIKTNPICYQFWMKKEESSLAKKIQPNHANLVRHYLSFNRLKHAIFYLSSFFVSVKLVLCAIKVSRSLHSVYSCSSWNFDRMKLGLGTGMPNPKWFHLFVLRINYFLKS